MIYVLRCEGDKYYVGSTEKTVEDRFMEHQLNSNKWVQTYRPKDIVEKFECDEKYRYLLEDYHTKRYMLKYGIENVRGGSYSSFNLCSCTLFSLTRELRSGENKCFKCGGDHYAKVCPHKFEHSCKCGCVCDFCKIFVGSLDEFKSHIDNNECASKCYTCGKSGHWAGWCPEKKC